MVYKVINTRETRNMSEKQMNAVLDAFERFQPEWSTQIKVAQREHLGSEFDPKFCCEHTWTDVAPEMYEYVRKRFDETDLGDRVTVCPKCQAFALWEDGKLFAYDAIMIEEEKQESKPRRPRRNK